MKLLKNYGLSIVLFLLFLGSWIAQGFYQWQEFFHTAEAHNSLPKVSEFIDKFLSSTFENWQSEFLQLFTFAVLSSFLIHKGSPQSKDSDAEIKTRLTRIERKLFKQKI